MTVRAFAAGEPARSPFFCGDFLHDVELDIAFGDKPLQPRILCLKLLQAPHFARLKAAETLAPRVNRLFADSVPLGHRRNLIAIGLPDDRNDLLFRESPLARCSVRIGEPVSLVINGPKFQGQVTVFVQLRLNFGGKPERLRRLMVVSLIRAGDQEL
jgi:hypothetical protein